MSDNKHQAITDAQELLQLEEQAREQQREDAIYRLGRAVMLAPNIAICEALLRGEHVPISRLDPDWVRRYGLRETA